MTFYIHEDSFLRQIFYLKVRPDNIVIIIIIFITIIIIIVEVEV